MSVKFLLRLGALSTIVICMLIISSLGTVAGGTELKIFHAGSLAVPLKQLAEEFERTHPGVTVHRESMGSVLAVRQITELGKTADILASADYTLIPSMMYPEFANFYIIFARNRMVVAYTKNSKYMDKINGYNWYNILRRGDVRFGFSNPNFDPCGYRTPMVLQLAELFYVDDHIFEDLVVNNTAITVTESDGNYLIMIPEDLRPNTEKVSIRPKSVALLALLESGGLDYAFEYMSVAKQHGLNFVELPEEIDLSSVDYKDLYSRVQVELSDGKIMSGKPIVYGITVPLNAPHPKLAIEFLKLVISEEGQKVFSEAGQPPIVPAIGSGDVPEELKTLVKTE